MLQTHRWINAIVGLVDGGVGVNWEFLGFDRDEFKVFLHSFLEAMGFVSPTNVYLEKNGSDGKVDWNRVRISAEECQLHGVEPRIAARRAREWLGDSRTWNRYGIRFDVAQPPAL